VRTLADKNKAQDGRFQLIAQESLAHCRKFEEGKLFGASVCGVFAIPWKSGIDIEAWRTCGSACSASALARFEEVLPSQTSLAAFQGVDMRCKKVTAAFRPLCEEDNARLETMVTVEPSKLLQSNNELLRTCRLFQESGDYDQKEIDLLKAKLDKPIKAVESSVSQRNDKIKEIRNAQDKAMGKVKDYRARYDACVLDLCLREGLGQKYGAPRRVAQERCRTEQCRDAKDAQQLGDFLISLEDLCRRATSEAQQELTYGAGAKRLAGRRLSTAKRREAALAGQEPLAISLCKTLLAIRKCSFKRGLYLEYLKAPSTINSDMDPPLDLEEQDGTIQKGPELEVTDNTIGTFTKAIESMEEECKAATKKLYASDGKQASLGPDGIPESLKLWLQEKKEKMLGEGGCRLTSITGFTEHVGKLEQLLGLRSYDITPAPAAYLEDITRRAIKMAYKKRDYRYNTFTSELQPLDLEKEKHRAVLR